MNKPFSESIRSFRLWNELNDSEKNLFLFINKEIYFKCPNNEQEWIPEVVKFLKSRKSIIKLVHTTYTLNYKSSKAIVHPKMDFFYSHDVPNLKRIF